jgi:hypothetical protein
MKKTLAMLLAMLTLLSLLAGCAKEPEVTPDPDPVPTPTPTPGPGDPTPAPTPTPDPTPAKPAEPKIYLMVTSNVDDSLNPMQAGTTANGELAGFLHGTLYQNYPGEDRISSYYGPELAAEMPIDVNGDGTNDYYFSNSAVDSKSANKDIWIQLGTEADGLWVEANPNGGYDLVHRTVGGRKWYDDGRQYLYPVPAKVIRDYAAEGYKISQNNNW